MVLSRVRLIRVRLVLVNLNPINDTYRREDVQRRAEAMASTADLDGPEAESTTATTVWIFVRTRYH